MAVAPDGRTAYATSLQTAAVLTFAIDAASGSLTAIGTPVAATGVTRAIAVAPDGTSVFTGGSNLIHQFARDPASGLLTARSPATVDATDPSSSSSVLDLRTSNDGTSLYAVKAGPSFSTATADIFQYTIGPGGLTAKSAPFITVGPCQAAGLTQGALGSGSTLYATCGSMSNLVAVPIAADGSLATPTPTTPQNANQTLVQASADGRFLFAAANANVVRVALDPAGAVTGDAIALSAPLAVDVLVSPLQLITPALSAAPAAAGAGTGFTAAGSTTAPGAAIVRYDWAFGDGTTLADGGPAPTHVYGAAGTYTATVSMTASGGAYTGRSMLRNPTATASTTVAVPPPTPGGGGGGEGGGGGGTTLEPVVNRSLLAQPQKGRVVVRVPGSRTSVPLAQLRSIPVGSLVDARRGTVRITVAVDARGTTQSADFHDGLFEVLQRAPKSWERRGSRTPRRVTELVLRGEIGPCPRTRKATKATRSASAAATTKNTKRRRAPKTRRLWGNGKGDFSTKGRYSSATVRGTEWLVQDSCAGTLTRVRHGRVTVRDLKRLRTSIVKAGGRRLVRR